VSAATLLPLLLTLVRSFSPLTGAGACAGAGSGLGAGAFRSA